MSWKKRLMDIEGQLEKGTERQRDWWRMQWASKKKKLVEDTEGQREKEIGGGDRGPVRKRDWCRIQRDRDKNRLSENTEGQ